MHLLLRTLLLLFRSARRRPLTVWDSASLPLRVLPTDIDIAMHVNNGMYLSLMDLGRFDLMVRSGVWKRMRRRGWSPVVAAETISFRKSLQLWQEYTIETRVIGLDAKAIFFEQRMVADGEIYARAYIATRLVTKAGPVSQEQIVDPRLARGRPVARRPDPGAARLALGIGRTCSGKEPGCPWQARRRRRAGPGRRRQAPRVPQTGPTANRPPPSPHRWPRVSCRRPSGRD